MKASDNEFPSILLADTADPAAPADGHHRLFIDTDEKLKMIDHASLVTDFTPSAAGDITTDAAWAAKGDLIVGTANNTAAVLTAGTNGKVLTAASGEATGLKWDTAAAGALVLVEQHTAANSATLDFTTCISATYDEYLIEIVQIVPISASYLKMLVSVDGGANWDTTAAHYTYSQFVWSGAGTALSGADTAYIPIYPLVGRNVATTLPCSGSFRLFNPLGSTYKQAITGTMLGGDSVTSNVTQTLTVSASYNQVAAFDAFRFIMSSGNISTGTIRVYGIAKA